MKKYVMLLNAGLALTLFSFYGCSENKTDESEADTTAVAAMDKPNFGGYETKEQWGEHLVTIGGCHDCHTPKKMTPMGPVDDSSLLLSGHPEAMPAPDVDRKKLETQGFILTATFTSWVGPWGISYSANLTPDPTGTGNWTEDQFVYALRNMISKGLPGGRPLMPPMAMMPVKHMTDGELRAIYAYLRTVKPVKNSSVQPTAPALARKS
ncbi:MAG TPA: diheme cytochrome c-553 [Chitinophagaceae bacterium]|nr:diheme cytochrome c-553 [Chitinophagaceae bacterium]